MQYTESEAQTSECVERGVWRRGSEKASWASAMQQVQWNAW